MTLLYRSLLILYFCSLAGNALCAAGQPLTHCEEVLKLAPAEAKAAHAVKVKGAVTCYVPSAQLCFVQDESAGVYVFPAVWPRELAFGEIVEVEGVSGNGRFSPIIEGATLRRLGLSTNLAPRIIALEELSTGRYDSQLVQIQGVCQQLRVDKQVTRLQLAVGSSIARILVFGAELPSTNLVNAEIGVQGVAGTFYSGGQLSGFGVFVTQPQHIEIRTPAPEPFSAPLRSARNPAWFSPEGGLDHRIRLRGTVTVTWPGEAFFLRDESGGMRVRLADRGKEPAAGEGIEAIGFAQNILNDPVLTEALTRATATNLLVSPDHLTLQQIVTGPVASGQFVSTEGGVESVRKVENGRTLLTITNGPSAACVFVPGVLPVALERARVRIAGVWSSAPAEFQREAGAGLWVNQRADVVVLTPAPPEASQVKREKGFALAAGGLLLLGGMALAFERKAARAAAARQAAQQRVAELDREVHRLTDARERLGRNLHDQVIQSIYAVGLNVDDCSQLLVKEPEKARSRLKTALMDINGVIRELRNVILGLETSDIQPQEFRTALKSIALALGEDKSNRMRLNLDQEALDSLTPAQATELIHIAREALSNSIRHGRAQTTTFDLHATPENILFSVEDDGCGFNPEKVSGSGFGLRNMAKRAENLGANFTIHAQEGDGTRIVLDIPRQKQHLSKSESRSRLNR